MNRATLLPLVFLCATTSILAQTRIRPTASSCPVGMEATHGRSLPVSINAGPAPQRPAINQQIHLEMTNLVSRDMVSAQLTAHGFSNKQRTIYPGHQVPDLTSTVNVSIDVKGNGHASSDLSLSHFTAVASLDLDSITYADGSTWRSSSPGACSVVPKMVMLIAAAH